MGRTSERTDKASHGDDQNMTELLVRCIEFILLKRHNTPDTELSIERESHFVISAG